jgi:hypothetical protein
MPILALIAALLASGAATAQDHRHPPQDAQAHATFYWHLTRPDQPNAMPGSCCGMGDCYPAPARYVNGRWEALRREDRAWIVVPNERVVTREDQLARRTDHQATLCATPTFTYCFVAPQTGI